MHPAQHAACRRVLTEREAGVRTGLSTSYLRKLRYIGGGPAYLQLASRRIGYYDTDLDIWLDHRRVPGFEAA